MIPVDGEVLRAVAPRFSGAKAKAQARIIDSIDGVLESTLASFQIDTRLRIAHFLAQITHESAGLRTTEEFASGERYEGRKDLGNTKPGDGPRYKGRGLLQLTGRANYRRFGKLLDLDLEGDPETAADPKISLQIACEYWKDRKINPDCDADNLTAVTRKVNGGLNGLQDRRGFLVKAKAALVRLEGIAVLGNAPRGAKPALRRGSSGDAVEALQETLRKLDFPIAIDADFGAATELAVMKFQAAAGLKPDGIVGPQTMAAIEKAAK